MENKTNPAEALLHVPNRTEEAWESSEAAKSLQILQLNPRVKYIVVIAPENACPACQKLVGTYPKDKVPRLPIDSCSHPLGCRAYYMPYLDEIFP